MEYIDCVCIIIQFLSICVCKCDVMQTINSLRKNLLGSCVGSEKSPSFGGLGENSLTAESVQGTSLTLEGVDHIHGGHGLPLGVLGVGHRITDHVLKEHLEDTTGLLVDQTRDTLDTTTMACCQL